MVLKLNKKKVIVIIGPTGIGKTDLALVLAKKYGFSIISADAFQIYKEINIGTNKPNLAALEGTKYYGLDLIELNHNYSIFEFQKYARDIIDNDKNPVIIVGGSMLYLDSVIYDYSLRPEFDNSNKHEWISDEALYEQLLQLDPLAAKTISKSNRKRIITALNYFLQFKESIRANNNRKELYYDVFTIYLKPDDKKNLNEKNKLRINKMIQNGWIDEVKTILDKYPDFLNYNAAKAIGYLEIANAILNKQEIDVERISIKTNQYVKHQLSWYNNHYSSQENVYITNNLDDSLIYEKINLFLKNE